jgi:hypothetical protein
MFKIFKIIRVRDIRLQLQFNNKMKKIIEEVMDNVIQIDIDLTHIQTLINSP